MARGRLNRPSPSVCRKPAVLAYRSNLRRRDVHQNGPGRARSARTRQVKDATRLVLRRHVVAVRSLKYCGRKLGRRAHPWPCPGRRKLPGGAGPPRQGEHIERVRRHRGDVGSGVMLLYFCRNDSSPQLYSQIAQETP